MMCRQFQVTTVKVIGELKANLFPGYNFVVYGGRILILCDTIDRQAFQGEYKFQDTDLLPNSALLKASNIPLILNTNTA